MFQSSIVNIRVLPEDFKLSEEIELGYLALEDLEKLKEYNVNLDERIPSVLANFSSHHLAYEVYSKSPDKKTKTIEFKHLNKEEKSKILSELVDRGVFDELKIKVQKL